MQLNPEAEPASVLHAGSDTPCAYAIGEEFVEDLQAQLLQPLLALLGDILPRVVEHIRDHLHLRVRDGGPALSRLEPPFEVVVKAWQLGRLPPAVEGEALALVMRRDGRHKVGGGLRRDEGEMRGRLGRRSAQRDAHAHEPPTRRPQRQRHTPLWPGCGGSGGHGWRDLT